MSGTFFLQFIVLILLPQAHCKAAIELQGMSAFSEHRFHRHVSLPFHNDHFDNTGTRNTQAVHESSNVVVLQSPLLSEATLLPELQVDVASQNCSSLELSLLGSIRNHGIQQTIDGISQQNKELLKAAGAIHKRYENKVTAALKEFRREITELEHQFSMRRVDEALATSLVPVMASKSPLSIPAAGTLKSKQKGYKAKPL